MLNPPDFPWILLSIPGAFITLMLYGYWKTGDRFSDLLMPDSRTKIGNHTTRFLARNVIQKIADGYRAKPFAPSIHVDIPDLAFEERFSRHHPNMVRDVAEMWLQNKNFQLGYTYQFVVGLAYDNVILHMFDLPELNVYHDGIMNSVRLVAAQYDWSES